MDLGIDDTTKVGRLDVAIFDRHWERVIRVEPGVLYALIPLPAESWWDLLMRLTARPCMRLLGFQN